MLCVCVLIIMRSNLSKSNGYVIINPSKCATSDEKTKKAMILLWRLQLFNMQLFLFEDFMYAYLGTLSIYSFCQYAHRF